jgi:hypothetical protein
MVSKAAGRNRQMKRETKRGEIHVFCMGWIAVDGWKKVDAEPSFQPAWP